MAFSFSLKSIILKEAIAVETNAGIALISIKM
jgi:hypothetical protein